MLYHIQCFSLHRLREIRIIIIYFCTNNFIIIITIIINLFKRVIVIIIRSSTWSSSSSTASSCSVSSSCYILLGRLCSPRAGLVAQPYIHSVLFLQKECTLYFYIIINFTCIRIPYLLSFKENCPRLRIKRDLQLTRNYNSEHVSSSHTTTDINSAVRWTNIFNDKFVSFNSKIFWLVDLATSKNPLLYSFFDFTV